MSKADWGDAAAEPRSHGVQSDWTPPPALSVLLCNGRVTAGPSGHHQPQAQQEALESGILMVPVIAPRMKDQAIVKKLDVARLEIHVQANAVAPSDFL